MRRRSSLAPFIALFLSAAFLLPVGTIREGSENASAVSGPGFWGTSETLWNVSTGTHAPSSIHGLTLIPISATDSVVLDGFLYLMTKADMVGTVATYSPPDIPGRTNDWNMSVEVTRPRE